MTTKFLTYGSTGTKVERLQELLNENRFHHPRRKLVVDGEMRGLTCGAVKDVKYWAGYDPGDMDPELADQVAGGFFLDLLSSKRPLPPKYKARRRARLAKAAEAARRKPLRLKILAAAQEDLGLIEGPNNAIKFNDWWTDGHNDGGAYCVRAGSYWAAKAGCPHVVRGSRWENTDVLLADAKAGRNGVHITSDPDGGNGFVIDWDGHADPDHFGEYVGDLPGDEFKSLEANAVLADGSGRQGVGYHQRPAGQCWFIVFED